MRCGAVVDVSLAAFDFISVDVTTAAVAVDAIDALLAISNALETPVKISSASKKMMLCDFLTDAI
jgi:hypothetical protein